MEIKIAKVYSSVLEETKIEPVVEKLGKIFVGQLFFEPLDEVVQEVLESITVPDDVTNVEIAKALFPLNKKYGLLASDGRTYSCNAHWAWVNGLADNLDAANYHINDSEVM